MAINEHTLVSKLSFAIFGDASARSLGELERIFLEHAPLFAKGRPDNPSVKQIGEWMKGRPLGKLGHYNFFKFVIDHVTSEDDLYQSVSAEQKKVFKQIDRFLTRRIAAFDSIDYQPSVAKRAGAVRWLEIKLVYDSLADNLALVRDDLEEERPNDPESIAAIEKSLEIIDMVENHLTRIDAVIVSSMCANDAKEEDMQTVVGQVAEEFRKWIIDNKPEVVDAVMRLTPATAFLGVLGLAGANMAWATPIVLAICGGKSVVDIVKGIQQ